MDIAAIAAAAVAASWPFLGHIADGAAKKMGEKAIEAGGKLAKWMRSSARGEAAIALAKLEAAPADVSLQTEFEKALTRQLEASPEEAAELESLLATGPTVAFENSGGIYNVGDMMGIAFNSPGASIKVTR